MKIPEDWENYYEEYIADDAYWYIPKAMTIMEKNVPLMKKRLKVLEKFEGTNWSDCQKKFVRELEKKKLFDRKKDGDSAAIGRMFKAVCSALGFAWVNDDVNILLTNQGIKFIKSNDSKIIKKQLERYQIYNPTFPAKFSILHVNPIYFITNVLLNLDYKYISKDEYLLFIAKQQNNDGIFKAVEWIEKYRKTPENIKIKLHSALRKTNVQSKGIKSRRSSIYNTIKLDRSYALQSFGLSSLIKYDTGLALRSKSKAKDFIKYFDKNELWIDFKEEKDWFLYYGENSSQTSGEYAKDYYMDISDIAAAESFISEKKKRGLKVELDEKMYRSILLDEKLLEDVLENNLEELEKGLVLVKRQKETQVGRIDLFARDKYGKCVVIELKKGRTADKVVGQTLRYVGYIKQYEENCSEVRAIIVGKVIDDKLRFAVNDTLKIPIDLFEFDIKASFQKKAISIK